MSVAANSFRGNNFNNRTRMYALVFSYVSVRKSYRQMIQKEMGAAVLRLQLIMTLCKGMRWSRNRKIQGRYKTLLTTLRLHCLRNSSPYAFCCGNLQTENERTNFCTEFVCCNYEQWTKWLRPNQVVSRTLLFVENYLNLKRWIVICTQGYFIRRAPAEVFDRTSNPEFLESKNIAGRKF